MGDFKGLADKLKIKENKYLMEAGKIQIGKGVFSYDERLLIPLSAISSVEIPEQEKNEQDAYELKIENHAGKSFYIVAPDMDFIKEIYHALMICLDDRSAVYSGKERFAEAGGEKISKDKMETVADMQIDHISQNKTAVPRKNAEKKEKKTGRAEDITMSILDDEWKTLEDYALERMNDFVQNDRNHTVCAALAAAAELKNKEKCKKILDVSGNDALDMIITGAPIAVKAIVNKIM